MKHYIFIYLICFDDFIYVHNNLQSPVRSEMTHVLINIYKHFLLILLNLTTICLLLSFIIKSVLHTKR